MLLASLLSGRAFAASIDIATPNLAGVYGGGTTTITGTGFAGLTDVYFGNVRIDPANWTLVTSKQLTVTIPPSENFAEGNVDVTIWQGSTKTTMRNGFVYARIDPTISDIQPPQVGYLGGETVTITGSDFSLTQSVTFNGVAADPKSFVVSADNQSLKVKVPPGAGSSLGPVTVDVQTSFGDVINSDLLTFYQKPPTITGVYETTSNLASAGINGGAVVKITGTDLTNAIGVKFGTVLADPTTIKQVSDTEISVTVPASVIQTASTVDLTVMTSTGSATRTAFFKYSVSNPLFTAITANTSPAFGGITVTLTGNAFYKTIGIMFGKVPADMSTLSIVNSGTMKVKVPPSPNLAQGSVDVTIITQTGRATLVKAFTYTRQDPVISSFSPTHGPIYGGYSITITGVGLADVTSVSLGENTYTTTRDSLGSYFTINPDGTLTLTLGKGNPGTTWEGPTTLKVTTPTGTAQVFKGYYYDPRSNPVISTITPPFSMDRGGTFVTVDGSNFDNLQEVRFAGAPGEIQSSTSTQIKLKTPPHSPSIVGITVQTARGYTTVANLFEYITTPPGPTDYSFIGSPPPTTASTNGTTRIHINGDNLSWASVTVGGVPATNVTSGLSWIECTLPVNTPGVKTIVVTTGGGSVSPSLMPTVTYVPQPVPSVTTASVTSGSVVGGTQVVINGANLQGATVTFDGLPATIVANPSDGLSVTVSTPLHPAPGNVPVVVSTPAGAPVTLAGGFTYQLPPPPTVTDFTPATVPGTGGSVITVKGTYLKGSTVTVDGTVVSTVQIISDSLLTFTAPRHLPGTVPVIIGNPAGSVVKQLTYSIPPYYLDSATPNTDSMLGGATITMTGSNLFGASVFFDSVPATNVVVAEDGKSLTATAPPHPAGPATIYVDNSYDGLIGFPNAFTYYTPMPTVTGISTPNGNGNTYGQTKFALTGTNLWNSTVLFDTSAATSIVVASDGKSLTGVVPAHAAGPVMVTLKTPGGTVILPDPFNYVIPLPELWSKDIKQGTTDGGTTVVVSGRYLNGATVTFDGVPATNLTIGSGGYSVTSKSPPHVPGPVTMVITTPGGSTPMLEPFTYVAPSPILTTISPSTALTSGGSTITLRGRYLWNAKVYFGSLEATSVNVAADGQSLTAVLPPRREGSVDVIVSIAGKTDAVLANGFSYVPQTPTLTGIEPNRGPLAGGTQIKLTGTDITPTSTVNFGSQVINPTTISLDGLSLVFTLPSSSSLTSLPVTVTTSGGTSGTMTFTYVPKPTLTSASATQAPLSGGSVTLTGTNFISGAKVNFNGRSITPDQIDPSGNWLSFTAPTVTAPVNVSYTVTTAGGTTSALTYAYVPKPVITSLSPVATALAGGTITVSGAGFLPDTKVNFNGQILTPLSLSTTSLTFAAASVASPAALSVTVTNIGGTSSPASFTYMGVPRIDSLSVTSGPETAGQAVRITGANLAGVTSVKFGTASATINSTTETTLDVTAPQGSGSVSIVATSAGGTSNEAAYKYIPKPAISTYGPSSGPFGGNSVTVNGSNFVAGSKVVFNGQTIVPYSIDSAGASLAFNAPSSTVAGTVSFNVVATGGVTSAVPYTYIAAPTLTSLSVTRGAEGAGQAVRITGTDLAGVTSVKFGTASATITTATATTLDVTAPGGTGTVNVMVTSVGGTSNGLSYTYVPKPILSGLDASNGPLSGGSIKVNGTGFVSGAVVTFNGLDITPSNLAGDGTSLTFIAPLVTTPRTVSLTVKTVGGVSGSVSYSYVNSPAISSISPAAAALGGGSVTVNGSDFRADTTVNFGGTVLTPVTIDGSGTWLRFMAPNVTVPGTVSLTVSNTGGTSNPANFDYVGQPQLTSLSVTRGAETAGQAVRIIGTDLAAVSSVKFGTASATITNATATTLDVTAPAGAGTVSVIASSAGGTSNGLSYVYVPKPAISSLGSASGPLAGGSVTVNGSNFGADAVVTFDGQDITPSTLAGDGTSLTFAAPSLTAARTVSLTVRTVGGASDPVDYSYVSGPGISGITPAATGLGGGSVTVNGSDLRSGSVVNFGNAVLTPTAFANDGTWLTFTAPTSTVPATVSLSVSNTGGTSNAVDFNYVAAPALTSLSVTRGPEAAGQAVRITGTNLAGVTSVKFGAASATITNATATTLDVTAPAGTGTVSVTVASVGGTATGLSYQYVPKPAIAGLDSPKGPFPGGPIKINGSAFVSGAVVTIDGQDITPSSLAADGTSLTFTAPAVTAAKTVSLTVRTVGGVSSSASYDYVAAPSISSILPASAPFAGGSVTLSGTGFLAGTVVDMGGKVLVPDTLSGSTSLTFTAPSVTAAGTFAVQVKSAGGTSNSVSYTYVAAPTIISLSVTRGPETAGQALRITGTDLAAVTSVKFGTAAATIINATATTLDVTVPAGTGTVSVTVASVGGTSSGLSYSYIPQPVISGLSVSMGPLSGGSIRVDGTDFVSGTLVTFNGQDITPSSLASDGTSLTFTAPSVTVAGTVALAVKTVGGVSGSKSYDYVAAPVLASLSVTRGAEAAGQVVRITGTDLAGVTSVKFGTALATITHATATTLDVTAPAGSGTVNVTAFNPGGASNTLSYAYVPKPAIKSLGSVSGPLMGGSIKVNGTDLVAGAVVTFDGQDITPSNLASDGTSLTFVAPLVTTARTVSLTVRTVGGVSGSLSYDYRNGPGISAITPVATSLGGGSVRVEGTNFTSDTTVNFGGAVLTPVTIDGSGTWLTFAAPSVTVPGTVSLTVSNTGGTSNPANFDYMGQPQLTSLSVTRGAETAGQAVRIIGTDLAAVSSVKFGAASATITNATATTLDVTAPAGAGTVSVNVSSAGGTSNGLSYVYVPKPAISSLGSASGPLAGGSVTVNGSNFGADAVVTFDGKYITPSTSASDGTSLTFTAPSVTAARTVSLTVRTVGGASEPVNYSYVSGPGISRITPAATGLGGGSVTVNGSDLRSGSVVNFGNAVLPPTAFANDGTWLTFTAPTSTVPATVSLSVSNTGGTSEPVDFNYVAAPALTSLSVTRGPEAAGQAVRITGTNLADVTSVKFGAASATITNATDTTLDVTAPGGAGTVSITVASVGGTATGLSYQYVPQPTLTGMSPNRGPIGQPAPVTLTGTNLGTDSVVFFGSAQVAPISFGSNGTSLTVYPPAATAAGDVTVTVRTAGGTTANSRTYTYVAAPTISGLSVSAGPVGGGTELDILGRDFSGPVSVTFGGTVLGSFTVSADESKIHLVTPPGVAGTAAVTVTADGGTVTSSQGFDYLNAPVISGLSMSAGPEAGGQTMLISGRDLSTVSAVHFGSVTATITHVEASAVEVTIPRGSGSVDVTVDAVGGSSNAVRYQYVPVPVIAALDVTMGASLGGDTVMISGSGLADVTSVSFGGNPARIVNASAHTLQVVTPAGTGAVDVIASSSGGTSSAASFLYVAVPHVKSLVSSAGPEAGGQTVHVVGTDLAQVTSVWFGSVAAAIVPNSVSATGLDVIAPGGTGSVAVSVRSPGGTSNTATYSYAPVPVLTSLDVSSGPLGGGTRVTMTGSGFISGTLVHLGAQTLTPDSIASNGRSLVFTTQAGSGPGPVTVSVETAGGPAAATAQFTYLDGPVLTRITPASGSSAGGQTVRLVGSGLLPVTEVKFGGLRASIVPGSVTPNNLDVVTPAGSGMVDVTVVSPGGTSNVLPFTYMNGPQISAISPVAGPVAGGFELMITGTSLGGGASSGLVVTVDGVAVSPVSTASDGSWIKLAMPAHAAGQIAVVVQTTAGSATAATGFTYLEVPMISGLSPAEGPVAGGTVSEISGQNFTSDMTVLVDGAAARIAQFIDPQLVRVVMPAHASGQGMASVTVKTAGGEAQLASAYEYVDTMTATPPSGALPVGQPGDTYRQTISIANGTGPYAFDLSRGSLPDGLSLDPATGEISGTIALSASGQSSFTVEVTDQRGRSIQLAYTIAVGSLEFAIPDKVIALKPGETLGSVNLTDGVSGGPFLSATVISVDPPEAGTATITPGATSAQRVSQSRSAPSFLTRIANLVSQPSPSSAVGYDGFDLNFTPAAGYVGKAAISYQVRTVSGRTGSGTVTFAFNLDPIMVGSTASRLAQRFVDQRRTRLTPALDTPTLLDRQSGLLERSGRMRFDPAATGLRMGFDVTQPLFALDDDGTSPATFWARVNSDLFQRSDADATGKPSDWGTFALFSAGVDYRVSDRLLLGITLDYHRMSAPMDANAQVTGTGWMVGPYASVRLLDQVYLDATLLYGETSNDLMNSLSRGEFNSTVLLARTELRGEFDLGGVTVSPSLQMDYFSEEIETFEIVSNDGQVISVPGFRRREMRTSVGLDFRKSYQLGSGIILTPQLSLAAGLSGLDGTGLFGSVTAGMQVSTPRGWNLDAAMKTQAAVAQSATVGFQSNVSRRF